MNDKDREELERMHSALNEWKWPRALGSRPPRCYTVEDNDDIRIAYRLMDAIVRWARRQK